MENNNENVHQENADEVMYSVVPLVNSIKDDIASILKFYDAVIIHLPDSDKKIIERLKQCYLILDEK